MLSLQFLDLRIIRCDLTMKYLTNRRCSCRSYRTASSQQAETTEKERTQDTFTSQEKPRGLFLEPGPETILL